MYSARLHATLMASVHQVRSKNRALSALPRAPSRLSHPPIGPDALPTFEASVQTAQPGRLHRLRAGVKHFVGKLRAQKTKGKAVKSSNVPSPQERSQNTAPATPGEPFHPLLDVPEPECEGRVRQRLMEAHDLDSRQLELHVQQEVATGRHLPGVL